MKSKIAAAVAALALAATGCGGDGGGTSKSEYVKEFNAVGKTLEQELGSLTSSDPKKLGSQLKQGADTFADAARKFGEIEPPEEARVAHDQIVGALDGLAKDFRGAAKGVKSSDPAAVLAAVSELQGGDSLTQLMDAGTKLAELGYEIQ